MNKSFYVYDVDIYKLQCDSDHGYDGSHFKPNINTTFNRITKDEIIFSHFIHLNNHGYRDNKDFEIHKEDTFRIITIGDSFTSGFDCEKSWPYLLQEKLFNKKLQGRSNVEVLNLGIPGAGPANWITVLPLIQDLNPDLVIVAILDNILNRPKIRFYSNPLKCAFFCSYEGFDDIYCKGLINKELSNNINSTLIKEMHDYFLELTQNKKSSPEIDNFAQSYFFSKNKEHIESIVEGLKKKCKIIIAQIPSEKTFNHNELNPFSIFLNKFQSNCISVINLKKEMQEFKKEDLYLEHHWNSLGNEIAAKIFKNVIIKQI